MTWTYKQFAWALVIVVIGYLENLGRIEQSEVYAMLLVIIVMVLLDISASVAEIEDE